MAADECKARCCSFGFHFRFKFLLVVRYENYSRIIVEYATSKGKLYN